MEHKINSHEQMITNHESRIENLEKNDLEIGVLETRVVVLEQKGNQEIENLKTLVTEQGKALAEQKEKIDSLIDSDSATAEWPNIRTASAQQTRSTRSF